MQYIRMLTGCVDMSRRCGGVQAGTLLCFLLSLVDAWLQKQLNVSTLRLIEKFNRKKVGFCQLHRNMGTFQNLEIFHYFFFLP